MKRFVVAIGVVVACAIAAGWAIAQPSPNDVARYAADLMARNYRPDAPGGAVLVARGDTVLFRAARGLANVEQHVPLQPDSVFRIGSITKQFTAAGLLTLVEAGRVNLDDPLAKYLPGFPGGERITVRQLLNHTSGVKSYSALPTFVDRTIRSDMTTAEIIDLFKNEKPDFPPGTQWAYSNSGYALAGAIIETVTGEPWHAYLERTLFKPIGMTHTGYGHDPRFAALQVPGYTYEGTNVIPMRPMSMTQPHAAGALVSNVDDLLKWNRALHEGRILKDLTYRQMITPTGRAADPGIGYGFGLFNDTIRGAKVLQHGGRIFGFIASLTYLPGPDITVVVLENDDLRGAGDSPEVTKKLAAMALGDPYPEMRAIPVDQAALRSMEGVYRFAPDTTRVLRVVDGQLTSQRNTGPRSPLTPIAADDFLFPDGFNRLKVERDASGTAKAIRFFANGDGVGELGQRTNEPLPVVTHSLQLPRAALDRLTGTYANSGVVLKVFMDGEALRAQIAGQPPMALRATSPTQFVVEETGATLEFPQGAGAAEQVTIRQGGREVTLKRTG